MKVKKMNVKNDDGQDDEGQDNECQEDECQEVEVQEEGGQDVEGHDNEGQNRLKFKMMKDRMMKDIRDDEGQDDERPRWTDSQDDEGQEVEVQEDGGQDDEGQDNEGQDWEGHDDMDENDGNQNGPSHGDHVVRIMSGHDDVAAQHKLGHVVVQGVSELDGHDVNIEEDEDEEMICLDVTYNGHPPGQTGNQNEEENMDEDERREVDGFEDGEVCDDRENEEDEDEVDAGEQVEGQTDESGDHDGTRDEIHDVGELLREGKQGRHLEEREVVIEVELRNDARPRMTLEYFHPDDELSEEETIPVRNESKSFVTGTGSGRTICENEKCDEEEGRSFMEEIRGSNDEYRNEDGRSSMEIILESKDEYLNGDGRSLVETIQESKKEYWNGDEIGSIELPHRDWAATLPAKLEDPSKKTNFHKYGNYFRPSTRTNPKQEKLPQSRNGGSRNLNYTYSAAGLDDEDLCSSERSNKSWHGIDRRGKEHWKNFKETVNERPSKDISTDKKEAYIGDDERTLKRNIELELGRSQSSIYS